MIAMVKRFMARQVEVPLHMWLIGVSFFVLSWFEVNAVLGFVNLVIFTWLTWFYIQDSKSDSPVAVITITADRSKPPSCPLGRWHTGSCPPSHKGVNK